MAFDSTELILKDNTNAEQIRTREIFNVLKDKAIKRKELTEKEKDFFCRGVKFSILNDGDIEDYPCCENYNFKILYLIYFRDLTGQSVYHKVNGMKHYKASINEVQQDLHYLYKKSDEWELLVYKTNHTEKLLQQLATEVRNESFKKLNNLPEFKNISNLSDSVPYLFKKRAILLQSKFIYCIGLEIFQNLKPSELLFEINSIQIEFNEFSLIHILNRHFSEIAKQYNTNKSFHNEDFKPRILNTQLKEIFQDIDTSKLLLGKSIDKVVFQNNGIDYIIYTSEREKSIKGENTNIKYRRLDTFFPVSDSTEKNKLISFYELKTINKKLSIYIPL